MSVSFPPKKNTAHIFGIGLISRSTGQLQNTPTIAAGDVKVSIDGSSYTNLTNLPTTTPPASPRVQVSLTTAEMNGDKINILFQDQAGAEWNDLMIEIETSVRQIDDLTYPTYQLADAVASDGSIPTLQQALYMIIQFLAERQVVGTTVTVKKPDGSTTLMTFSLNDATNPTSITRSA